MKNHEYIHTVNEFTSSGIYRINLNKFHAYFEKERLDNCRSWTFRPVFVSDKVVLIDTYSGYKGIEVKDEMLQKNMIEFVCDSYNYIDLGTDAKRVENYRPVDYEIVRLDSGEVHYLLLKDATEDREIKLKNLIGKRHRLLLDLEKPDLFAVARDAERTKR